MTNQQFSYIFIMRLVEGAGADRIFDFIEQVTAVFQQQEIDTEEVGEWTSK